MEWLKSESPKVFDWNSRLNLRKERKRNLCQESYGIRTAAYHVHQITIIFMPFFPVQYAACVCDVILPE